MKKLLAALSLTSLFLVACHNDTTRLNDTKLIKINSQPEGAMIVVNGLNLGKTPLEVEFAVNEFACFIRPATIMALPQDASLFTQVKSYPRFSPSNKEESKAPDVILMDMTMSPQQMKAAQEAEQE